MLTSEAERYLTEYIESSSEPKYALMLSGAWGAGKTTFVENYLKNRERQSKERDPLFPRTYVYVTLYGVTKPSDITAQIFAQIYPTLASRPFRLFVSLAGRIASVVAKRQIVNEGDAADIYALMIDLRTRTLVFDDLERCALPIVDTLGIINRFLEHDKLKTIIVANEKQIEPHEIYLEHKEKVVGKTIEIVAPADSVFDTLVGALPDTPAKIALASRKQIVVDVLRRSSETNYRSLHFAIMLFCEVFSHFSTVLQDK